MIKRIYNALRRRYIYRLGGEHFLNYLREQGVTIGKNCTVPSPESILIDTSRPYLVEIGDEVRLNKGLTVLTHDFTSFLFKNLYGELLPCSGKVSIGNNVYFGQQCTVLKGVSIGDNCIIGYGSVVMTSIPANSVAVGRPAKVICSIDEYYKKRQKQGLEESLELARIINQKLGRRPVPSDFKEEFVYFVNGNEIDKYPELPIQRQLTCTGNCYEQWVKNHKAPYSSFDEFLKAAGIE